MSEHTELSAEEVLRRIEHFRRQGDIPNAIQNADILVRMGYPRGYMIRAALYVENKQWHAAIADYTQSLGHSNQSDHSLYRERAFALAQKGAWERAIKDYTRAIKLTPRSERGMYCKDYLKRARLLVTIGENNPAVRDYRRYLRLARKTLTQVEIDEIEQAIDALRNNG
jgi:tetratricopeptide (TPR) repeat protein